MGLGFRVSGVFLDQSFRYLAELEWPLKVLLIVHDA